MVGELCGAVQLSGTWRVGAPHASQHTAVVTTQYRVNVGCKRGALSRLSARTHMDSNTNTNTLLTPPCMPTQYVCIPISARPLPFCRIVIAPFAAYSILSA